MSGLTRWGFDRKAGGPKRPVPLVRSCGEIRKVREANRLAARALAVSAACDRILTGRAEPNDRAVIEDWKVRRAVKPKEAAAESTVVALPVPKPKKKAKPRIKSGATVSGYQAKAGDEAAGTEHASPRPAVEPVSRPAGGRAAAATSEFMDVTAGETAPVPNPAEAAPPKQASAPVAVMAALPLAVSTRPAPARAPIGPTGKIDIAAVPSGMEAAAQKWKAPDEQRSALPPVPGEDGKVWCAGCDARVPTWFGRDCISATCSLKGSQ